MVNKKQLKIVFSVILSDKGEAARALEIAEGIRGFCPQEYELDIIFLSRGNDYGQKVMDSGFKIHKCFPEISGIHFNQNLKKTTTNVVGEVTLISELLKGEIQAFTELKPDIVLHGFYPIASLARRMTDTPILGICYLPIPLQEAIYTDTVIRDIPDMLLPLTYLPVKLRREIVKSIPKALKLKAPIFEQTNVMSALKGFEWTGEPIKNLFDMLIADFTIVNDFEEFYKEVIFPDNYKVVGPLYVPPSNNDEIDENILKLFSPESKRLKVFCAIGSSGEKKYLFEAIKALTQGVGKDWSAVILVPQEVCPINEARACAGNCSNIYITDSFVPALLVSELADVVITHGGQETIQTAIASGTPIVGFAMQPVQQINLDNIVMRGAGIRIPKNKWNLNTIQAATKNIIAETTYKENAKILKKVMESTEGKENSALSIWKFILENFK